MMFVAQGAGHLVIASKLDDLPALEDVESAYLEAVLDIHGGDKRGTAITLGISLKTVYNKLARIEARRPHAAKGA